MNAEPKPIVPSDADTDRYDEVVRKLFPNTNEERQRHEALWKAKQYKTE